MTATPSGYMAMPIGRAAVVLRYDETGLLCVQRGMFDTRKLKLKRSWWRRAERYLANGLKPAIDGPTVTVTNISAADRIETAGALRALSNLLADGTVEWVSGGMIIEPPNSSGQIKVTANLVLRVPSSIRVH